MVVGDDDVEAELARAPDLLDGGDAAVDGQDEAATLFRQALERLAADAVALVEAARQMPLDLRAELPQHEHGEHRGADPVDVVVAVDADPFPGGDRRANPLDGRRPCRPSRKGSCRGCSPARKARATSGSP